jgi:hypothetical protein
MVNEETIKALVGHEFPGGEYLIEHWENFLLTQCTGSGLMKDNVVHPAALFHVPIRACDAKISELYELGHADSDASMMIESYECDMFQPLREDVPYKGSGKITEVERSVGEDGKTFDRLVLSFELKDPEGELTARSVMRWRYMRSE